jgi:hypothetical protein
MEYLCYTKIVILPYNSIDIKSRDETQEFGIDISEEFKQKLNINKTLFLKKDQLLGLENETNTIHKRITNLSNPILYISQNSLSDTLKGFEKGKVCIILKMKLLLLKI